MSSAKTAFRFPCVRAAMDGNSAVIMCERESTDAAGAFPMVPGKVAGDFHQAVMVPAFALSISLSILIQSSVPSKSWACRITPGWAGKAIS